MCENIRVLLPPPPPPVSMLVHEATVCRCVFHLSGQEKGLLLSWCAAVCDGTGKIEVRIGGGLVF